MIVLDIIFWIFCITWFNKVAFIDDSIPALIGTIIFTIASTIMITRYCFMIIVKIKGK